MLYEELLERLGLRREPPACFEEVTRSESLLNRRDLGVMTVPVEKIVGTVSRCRDITADFHPRDELRLESGLLLRRGDRGRRLQRLRGIREAIERGEVLPPLDLYRLRDQYYIVDGHHRMAVAKELDAAYVDAHVIEFLPPLDTPANVLANARSNFQVATGLHQIELTDPNGYDALLVHITEHQNRLAEAEGHPVSLREAAEDWRREVYLPVAMEIERELSSSAGAQQFMGKTVGDLYLLLAEYKWLESERQGRDIGLYQAMLDLQMAKERSSWVQEVLGAVVPCRLFGTCPLGRDSEDVEPET